MRRYASDKIHGDTISADRPDHLIYTRHEPVGVVGAIVFVELTVDADDTGRLQRRLKPTILTDTRPDMRVVAGTVWVNSYRVVSPAVPVGGPGDGGLGRESGHEAVREFAETKAVWVELTGAGATRDPLRLG